MKITLSCVLLTLILFATACGGSGDDVASEDGDELVDQQQGPVGENERAQRMWIGAELVDCVGSFPQECLQVRLAEDGEVEWFYDEIEGYTHIVGTAAVLDVAVSEVENPPADGSSLRYRLIEVVETTEGAGTAEVAGIEGVTWELIGFADGDLFDPVPGGLEAWISFDGTQATGFSGCNGFGGTYELDGASITFALSQTLIGCDQVTGDFESKFFSLLNATEMIEVTFDGRLILAPAAGLNLTFRPAG